MNVNEREFLEAHLLYDIPHWALMRGWIEAGKDGDAKITRKGREWIERQVTQYAKQISSARLSSGQGEDGGRGMEAL